MSSTDIFKKRDETAVKKAEALKYRDRVYGENFLKFLLTFIICGMGIVGFVYSYYAYYLTDTYKPDDRTLIQVSRTVMAISASLVVTQYMFIKYTSICFTLINPYPTKFLQILNLTLLAFWVMMVVLYTQLDKVRNEGQVKVSTVEIPGAIVLDRTSTGVGENIQYSIKVKYTLNGVETIKEFQTPSKTKYDSYNTNEIRAVYNSDDTLKPCRETGVQCTNPVIARVTAVDNTNNIVTLYYKDKYYETPVSHTSIDTNYKPSPITLYQVEDKPDDIRLEQPPNLKPFVGFFDFGATDEDGTSLVIIKKASMAFGFLMGFGLLGWIVTTFVLWQRFRDVDEKTLAESEIYKISEQIAKEKEYLAMDLARQQIDKADAKRTLDKAVISGILGKWGSTMEKLKRSKETDAQLSQLIGPNLDDFYTKSTDEQQKIIYRALEKFDPEDKGKWRQEKAKVDQNNTEVELQKKAEEEKAKAEYDKLVKEFNESKDVDQKFKIVKTLMNSAKGTGREILIGHLEGEQRDLRSFIQELFEWIRSNDNEPSDKAKGLITNVSKYTPGVSDIGTKQEAIAWLNRNVRDLSLFKDRVIDLEKGKILTDQQVKLKSIIDFVTNPDNKDKDIREVLTDDQGNLLGNQAIVNLLSQSENTQDLATLLKVNLGRDNELVNYLITKILVDLPKLPEDVKKSDLKDASKAIYEKILVTLTANIENKQTLDEADENLAKYFVKQSPAYESYKNQFDNVWNALEPKERYIEVLDALLSTSGVAKGNLDAIKNNIDPSVSQKLGEKLKQIGDRLGERVKDINLSKVAQYFENRKAKEKAEEEEKKKAEEEKKVEDEKKAEEEKKVEDEKKAEEEEKKKAEEEKKVEDEKEKKTRDETKQVAASLTQELNTLIQKVDAIKGQNPSIKQAFDESLRILTEMQDPNTTLNKIEKDRKLVDKVTVEDLKDKINTAHDAYVNEQLEKAKKEAERKAEDERKAKEQTEEKEAERKAQKADKQLNSAQDIQKLQINQDDKLKQLEKIKKEIEGDLDLVKDYKNVEVYINRIKDVIRQIKEIIDTVEGEIDIEEEQLDTPNPRRELSYSPLSSTLGRRVIPPKIGSTITPVSKPRWKGTVPQDVQTTIQKSRDRKRKRVGELSPEDLIQDVNELDKINIQSIEGKENKGQAKYEISEELRSDFEKLVNININQDIARALAMIVKKYKEFGFTTQAQNAINTFTSLPESSQKLIEQAQQLVQ